MNEESKKNNGMGSALLALLGSLASTGVGAWIASRTQKKNFENQMDMAKYQTQVQEGLYNKYYSPSALMNQYEKAGLNPNLMYSNAGSGISRGPSFTAPTVDKYADNSSKFLQLGNMMSNLVGLQGNMYQNEILKEKASQETLNTQLKAADLTKRLFGLQDETLIRNDWANSFKLGTFNSDGTYTLPQLASIIGDGVSAGPLSQYQEALRTSWFNKAAYAGIKNEAVRQQMKLAGQKMSNIAADTNLKRVNYAGLMAKNFLDYGLVDYVDPLGAIKIMADEYGGVGAAPRKFIDYLYSNLNYMLDEKFAKTDRIMNLISTGLGGLTDLGSMIFKIPQFNLSRKKSRDYDAPYGATLR